MTAGARLTRRGFLMGPMDQARERSPRYGDWHDDIGGAMLSRQDLTCVLDLGLRDRGELVVLDEEFAKRGGSRRPPPLFLPSCDFRFSVEGAPQVVVLVECRRQGEDRAPVVARQGSVDAC